MPKYAYPILVGKLLMNPVDIPATSVINLKQYRIPGGQTEISNMIADLVDTTKWKNPE